MSSPLANLPLAAAPPIVAPQPKKPSTLYQRCIEVLPGSFFCLPKVLAEIVLQYVIPNSGAFAEVPFGTRQWQEYCEVEVDDDGNRLENPEELEKLVRIYLRPDPINLTQECWQTHTHPYYFPKAIKITTIDDSQFKPFTLERLKMLAVFQTALIEDLTHYLWDQDSVARMKNSPGTSCFLIARKQVLYRDKPVVEQLKCLDELGRSYAHLTVLEVATVVYLHYLSTKERLLHKDTEDRPQTYTSCIDELISGFGGGRGHPVVKGFGEKGMLWENTLLIVGRPRDVPDPVIGIMALLRI